MFAGSLLLACAVVAVPALASVLPDHEEFDAALQVPFRGTGVRPVTMHFSYPGATPGTPVAWEVTLLGHDGSALRTWQGHSTIGTGSTQAQVLWDGLDRNSKAVPAGYVTVRLRAIALDGATAARIGTGQPDQALTLAQQQAPELVEEQRRGIGDLLQAERGHLEHADLVGRPVAVLHPAQDAKGVAGIALEIQHRVDHVLDDARSGDLPILGDMADQYHRGAGFLGEAGECLRRGADLRDRAWRAVHPVGP